jgi:hypothetical protein
VVESNERHYHLTMEAVQPRVAQGRARASVWELVLALVGSILILPVALFAAVLGASDEWSDSVALGFIYGFPLVVWACVVAAVVYHWLIGWRRLWTLPLIVFVGFLFLPILLLLISSRIRRSVLPSGPEPRTGNPGAILVGGPPLENQAGDAEGPTDFQSSAHPEGASWLPPLAPGERYYSRSYLERTRKQPTSADQSEDEHARTTDADPK